jgi:hypothetical protein
MSQMHDAGVAGTGSGETTVFLIRWRLYEILLFPGEAKTLHVIGVDVQDQRLCVSAPLGGFEENPLGVATSSGRTYYLVDEPAADAGYEAYFLKHYPGTDPHDVTLDLLTRRRPGTLQCLEGRCAVTPLSSIVTGRESGY